MCPSSFVTGFNLFQIHFHKDQHKYTLRTMAGVDTERASEILNDPSWTKAVRDEKLLLYVVSPALSLRIRFDALVLHVLVALRGGGCCVRGIAAAGEQLVSVLFLSALAVTMSFHHCGACQHIWPLRS